MNDENLDQGKAGLMSPTDNELMVLVRDGKVEKLAILFERHQVMLYNFFLRLTGNRAASEDLVQEVFIRILKYREGYHSEGRFTIWLFQIARNAHIDYLRKHKSTLPLDELVVETPGSESHPEERFEADEEAALVRQALDRLSPKKKEILVLFRYQGLKLREIADLLGCQVGTVKAQVHRALKDLGRAYFDLQGGKIT
jgi:RNA polymerase sigma-70 factor (ECF subfamily)